MTTLLEEPTKVTWHDTYLFMLPHLLPEMRASVTLLLTHSEAQAELYESLELY